MIELTKPLKFSKVGVELAVGQKLEIVREYGDWFMAQANVEGLVIRFAIPTDACRRVSE